MAFGGQAESAEKKESILKWNYVYFHYVYINNSDFRWVCSIISNKSQIELWVSFIKYILINSSN